MIFLNNDNLGLKIKVLEFHGIHTTHEMVRHNAKIPTGNNFQSCHERDQTWKMIFDQHYFQNRNPETLFE